jgi:hypothetical protein
MDDHEVCADVRFNLMMLYLIQGVQNQRALYDAVHAEVCNRIGGGL